MDNLKSRKILIVDDQIKFKERFESVLKDMQEGMDNEFVVFFEKSFSDCIDAFNRIHPDLVLIGVEHNFIKTESICKSIRKIELNRHTGIIFYCKSPIGPTNLLPVQCLEAGADDFLKNSISDREILARITAVLRLKTMTDELRSVNHKLEILSLTDELTGLHNMRSFNGHLRQLVNRCENKESGLALIMLDLDKFKNINDTSNHLVGSFVIGEVGKLIRCSNIFKSEVTCAARYGGDEFIICFLVEDKDKAYECAELLRLLIESATFCRDSFAVTITSSLGVCFIPSGFQCEKPEHVIKAADVMLYKSKSQGRNQTSGMVLRYPIDFNHIGGTHLINWSPSGQYNRITRSNNS